MINEQFLQRAIDIRKTYLRLTNNMDDYLEKITNVSVRLEKTVVEITEIEEKYNKSEASQNISNDQTMKELLKVLDKVDREGKTLESLVDPLNKEIEKLSKEEVELYRLIREKHSNLTEDQIVETVKARLKKEELI
jgi:predicted  nucleic acid-binding Zn-ribbon protein